MPNGSVHMLVWNNFLNDARVLNEAITLVQSGYDVTVHAVVGTDARRGVELLDSGVKVNRHGTSSSLKRNLRGGNRLSLFIALLKRLKVFASMWRSVVKSRPDVLHIHDVNMLPLGLLLVFRLRIKWVYDAHEISASREGYLPLRGFVTRLERVAFKKAAGCITTSYLRSKYFARVHKCKRPLVLQNRPRLKFLPVTNTIAHALALTDRRPIVLYQGGLQPGRGLENFVRAAASILDAYFVLLGGGSLKDELQSLVHDLNVSDRVFFIPTVNLSELALYTQSADIGVQPIANTCFNHYSTDSNKLFEYLHAGLAVVASNLPEMRRAIGMREVGLLVKPGEQSDLAAAIQRLVTDHQLRNKFRVNSRVVASELCWDNQEKLLVDLYGKVLGAT